MARPISNLIINIGANTASLSQGLKSAEGMVRGSALSIGNLGRVAGTAALGGLALATTAVVGLGAASFASAMELDDAYDVIQAKTGATGDALDALKSNFATAFKQVPDDAEKVAEVVGTLNQRLGATGAELDAMSWKLLDSARIMKGDAATNAELFSRVLGDWGIPVQDGVNLLDDIFAASQASGMGMDGLMQKVVQFGAPMRLMGFSLTDSLAMLGKWEKEGVNTELVMGSLRIAAGNFAEAMNEGGVNVGKVTENVEKHQSKLTKLRDQLAVVKQRQSEFNDKTKESTKLQSQLKIDEITRNIQAEEQAIQQLSQTITLSGAPTTKSLRDQLMSTMTAIKNAASETEALSIGMETFGARAGPDMVAAIREGRFEIGDMLKVMEGLGGIAEAVEATEDWPEKFGRLKHSVMLSIAPIGEVMMDVAGTILDVATPVIATGLRRVEEITSAVAPKIQGYMNDLKLSYEEGGLGGLGEKIGADVKTLWSTHIEPEMATWPDRFWEWVSDPETGILARSTTELDMLPVKMKEWAAKVNFKTIGEDIGTKVIEGVKSVMGSDEQGESVLKAFLVSLGNAVLSLDKVIYQAGQDIATGLGHKIVENINSEFFKDLIKGALSNLFASLSPFGMFGQLIPAGQATGVLPGFAEGGVVPGRLGAPVLAVVHGGETITPAGQAGPVREDHYHLTINTNARVEQVANDFYLMRARARA